MSLRWDSSSAALLLCGIREAKLREAKRKLPDVHTRVCDLSKAVLIGIVALIGYAVWANQGHNAAMMKAIVGL